MNTLIKLYEAFPEKQWWADALLKNPNMTLEYIDSHPKLQSNDLYYGSALSQNPNLTIDYILKNPHVWWNWSWISCNPGITPIDNVDWPNSLTGIKNSSQRITMKDVNNNLNLRWDYSNMQRNPNLTIDFILEHYDEKKDFWTDLGQTKNITLEHFEQYPDIFNNYKIMSRNPNLTLDFVFNHPDDLDNRNIWDWNEIAKNPNITIQDVKKYPVLLEQYWFMRYFSTNPNMTTEFINQHPEVDWDYSYISSNPNITIDYVLNNLEKNWNWHALSANPSIDINCFEVWSHCIGYLERSRNGIRAVQPWIVNNPNLTYEWIINHPEVELDWGMYGVSSNLFLFDEYFDEPIIIRI